MKNYLPSKKFIYSLLTILFVGIVIFSLSYFFGGKSRYYASKEAELAVGKLTLNELIQKDADNDSVMDWEEALWGTDPNKKTTFDNISDAEYIKNKRKELNIAEGTTDDGQPLTETDKFSQEFFASIMAMKQSGQIDKNIINNVSSALGQRIADPTLEDKYSEEDIKISQTDNLNAQKEYYIEIKAIYNKYETAGIGNELAIIGEIATSQDENTDQSSIEELIKISNAYQLFSEKMILIPVPNSLISHTINIANSANNTGISIKNLSKMNSDPIIGLAGLSQYKKYSDDLIKSVEELEKTINQ